MIELKKSLINNLKNIPGWRSRRKLIVFESDDWGTNRISNPEVGKELKAKGVKLKTTASWCDTLVSLDDLRELHNVLNEFVDSQSNSACITMFVNPANPDFNRIKAADYKEYFPVSLDNLLSRIYPNEDVLGFWKGMLNKGTASIEYHGREHVNVPFWLQYLNSEDSLAKECFELSFCALPALDRHHILAGLRAAYYFDNESQKQYLNSAVTDGLKLLRKIFDSQVSIWCPPNNINHPDFNKILSELGISGVVSKRVNLYPNGNGGFTKERLVTGEKNAEGQVHYYRNCSFEPIQTSYRLKNTLGQINASFNWGKPAIITTHAVNFAGGIDKEMRNNSLAELKKLLFEIRTRWPEALFISSSEMVGIMTKKNS